MKVASFGSFDLILTAGIVGVDVAQSLNRLRHAKPEVADPPAQVTADVGHA